MVAPRLDRGLAAILITDVVGFPRLVEWEEPDTLGRVKAVREGG